MGEVVEVGPEVKNLKVGDRVVVPFHHRLRQLLLLQEASCGRSATTPTPTPGWPEKVYGYSGAGLFGYSHMMGGYAGGQAEYVRVPFADVGPMKVPDGLADEQVLFLSDIFPTGYMAAENCDIQPGRHRRRLGLRAGGPVRHPERLPAGRRARDRHRPLPRAAAHGREQGGAETINYEEADVVDALRELTGGRGPDACIDAVGMEAHGVGIGSLLRSGQADRAHGDRPAPRPAPGDHGLPQGRHGLDPRRLRRLPRQGPAGRRLRQGPDVQDGPDPRAPLHAAAAGARSQAGEIDPSFVITHRLSLDEAPEGYKIFRDKQDNCIKVVLKP